MAEFGVGFSLVTTSSKAQTHTWVGIVELLKETMTWLNSNGGAVTAIATVTLALVTIVYVYQAHRLVRETKETREMAMRPALIVTPELHEDHFNIIFSE